MWTALFLKYLVETETNVEIDIITIFVNKHSDQIFEKNNNFEEFTISWNFYMYFL